MADLPPSYSTLTALHMETARVCVITLNDSDKIRLNATPPELVQAIRQALHTAHGWNLIQAVDMSKKQTDKDSLFFELGQFMDRKVDMFSISFNRSDGIRVIDAPHVVSVVRPAIESQGRKGM
ncbi:hypothetical protein BG000_008605 [Podila horticola]|nr:hypothetical protein BG000_008605 [Podila horticola]